jgi:DNA helicase II / ATP-dependent DNA helicase PcrA
MCADDDAHDTLLTRALRRAPRRITSPPDGSVEGNMSDEVAFSEDLLIGLTPEQREAVTSDARRLLVRATAGSGKTHVLTLRIQRRITTEELGADQVLAMTFTRKAGEELRRRLFRAGIRDVRAGTFHRAAMTIVNEYRNDHHLKPLTIEANRRRIVALLAQQLRDEGEIKLDDWQLPRLEQEIGWALSQGFQGATYARAAKKARRDAPLAPSVFADVLDRYVGLCRSRGVLDFDLLLSEAIALLRDEPDVRAAFRHRTRALFVDETQDMNPLQFMLLAQMAGDDPDLFCVGDPNQSIYGFNGANPQLLADILRTWPDTVILDLTRNHRSTAHIIAVANTLLEPGARGIVPAHDDGEVPLVRGYSTDLEEAQHVATWLSAHHQPGSPWRSMAVLARTNAQLDVVSGALETAGIPFERRGSEHSPASDLLSSETTSRRIESDSADAVALSTIHRSKGLEFQHVVCVGWAEGQLPHYNATTAEELAEEQRLAYVALSRAEETLLITWSKGRNDPRFPDREPSRFLAPIQATLSEIERRNAPVTGDERRRRLEAIRRELEAATPVVDDSPTILGR